MGGMCDDRRLMTIVAVALMLFTSGRSVAVGAEGAEYLSGEARDRIVYAAQGWGELGFDCAVVPRKGQGPKLQIGDKEYERGLGHHANGEIFVELAGEYADFEADVGVQRQGGQVGSVVFQVFADDEKRFDSGVMTSDDPARPVRVSVEGAFELRMVVKDAGDGIRHDGANWANARLIPGVAAQARPRPGPLDAAPFARLMTWNPARKDGARSSRIEEFRAEDLFLGTEVLPGDGGRLEVLAAGSGQACTGLEWAERRFLRRLGVRFPDGASVPATEDVQIEFWTGESAWQGRWQKLQARIERVENGLLARVSRSANPDTKGGIQKIRWVVPAPGGTVALMGLSAETISPTDLAVLRIELAEERPGHTAHAQIEVYNGVLIGNDAGESPYSRGWKTSAPLDLTVRYAKSRPWKTDRTVLRFRLESGYAVVAAAFGVAVEDVLANGAVWVPHAGLFVTADPDLTLDEYRRRISDQRTVLDRVRTMPDQTFTQAWERVHNPIQDDGPMMLSLACDNRKFVAHRDGSVTFDVYDDPDQETPKVRDFSCKLAPEFGSDESRKVTRHLHGDWLPVPVTTTESGGVICRQRTFVTPYDDEQIPGAPEWHRERALCVVEYVLENPGATEAAAALRLAFTTDGKTNRPAELKRVDGGAIATREGRLLAFVDTLETVDAGLDERSGAVLVGGKLAAGSSLRVFVYLPAWKVEAEDYADVKGGEKWLNRVEAYWKQVLEPAMQIELPDETLTHAIRASQVHCLIAARNEAGGSRVAAWIATDRYGPLESEAHSVIRGMDIMGHHEFARRSLEFFIKRYNQAGFLTTGYTIMGTGWHLWTLAEHYQRTGDREWLAGVAPEVARVCRWIVKQREKTKRLDVRGEKAPEYGLVPPGVAADWNRYAYRFVQETHYYAGLRRAAKALADADHPQADALLADAERFREDILRAYRWTQARAPVLPLRDGTWVPAYPGMLYCFGRIEDIIPGEDGNRSWCYDVELGAQHLAVLAVLEPDDPEVTWICDHMEDSWFLHGGMGDYPAKKNEADFFNLGGFSKVQPYYTRVAEIYALRDEVKPFVRSYFNTIPTLLSKETMNFWEHFHNRGAWDKTHETGYFLAQSRLMLVMERGDELWLAPFVTDRWLEAGKRMVIENAPTRFGPVSYTISSAVDRGFVEVVVKPPTRVPPERLVVRLRHPEGKSMKAVTVNGEAIATFDATSECIRVEPTGDRIVIRARY